MKTGTKTFGVLRGLRGNKGIKIMNQRLKNNTVLDQEMCTKETQKAMKIEKSKLILKVF